MAHVTLREGLPQNGQINDESPVSYYIWNIDLSDTERGKPLSIGLSLLSGSCEIYLSRNSQLLNSCDHGIGCPLQLFQAKRSCSINAPFVVRPGDDWYIENGKYYIAITNTEVEELRTDTYYNIAVYTAYTILYLRYFTIYCLPSFLPEIIAEIVE